ncbi:MAG: hypothetical protein R3C15_03990 [Thermoleophilia bacterium]
MPPWPEPSPSATDLWAAERAHLASGPDAFAVALSGGGNRAASFAIGVLAALHERDALRRAHTVSAVSGGTYALSWLLLQPYHAARAAGSERPPDGVLDAMFDPAGPYQRHLEASTGGGASTAFGYWLATGFSALTDVTLVNALRLLTVPLAAGPKQAVGELLNRTGTRRDYLTRIQRAYQRQPGAAGRSLGRELLEGGIAARRSLQLVEGVEPVTFPVLRDAARRAGLPAFVFNATVRTPRGSRAQGLAGRHFELASAGLGSDATGWLAWEDTEGHGWEPGSGAAAGGPRWRDLVSDERNSPFATVRNVNVASAISGAAVSGSNLPSRWAGRAVSLLNVGLEYAVPSLASPRRLLWLSDGGHCENLGAYALLRRGHRRIVVVDAEHDPLRRFVGYGRLRTAARELGLELRVPAIDEGAFAAAQPVLAGTIEEAGATVGELRWIKLSLDPALLGQGEREAVEGYAAGHPAFPQESTIDQFFEPAQYRAYRALGTAVGRTLDWLDG